MAGVLEASRVELEWELSGNHPERWVGFAPALSLARVIKEAVHNTVKHAGATRVVLRFSFRDERLEIMVRDNGAWLVRSPSRGYGLSNMEKRVHELGGTFTIHAAAEGTEIHIVMPLPEGPPAEKTPPLEVP